MASNLDHDVSKVKKDKLTPVRRGTLELWNEFRLTGVPLSDEQTQALINHGYIQRDNLPDGKTTPKPKTSLELTRDFSVSTPSEIEASKYIDVVEVKESDGLDPIKNDFELKKDFYKKPTNTESEEIVKKAKKVKNEKTKINK